MTEKWHDLLAGLTPQQRDAVDAAIANQVASGWEPDRDGVADIVAVATGRQTVADLVAKFTKNPDTLNGHSDVVG
ncbi:antitoxin VbhA family protein [Parenemella sanctibonifatiensis]|uniref:Uncharacterized protein n=1 Tax=Parenemella sanctibonifatiensis TaxID=2016505 RepID=A0A255EDC5_9ACTN|nr:antitoxin VbhA family protein [Parenemella sanctibonifatiensis]OYN89549.1 hypothetical protein CGZ91_11760 [Parenemella sanctibonifatiensis]